MIAEMKLSQIAGYINEHQLIGDAAFKQVSTDTRTIARGDLFVALKGERFDGHRFLNQAIASGAGAAVVNHKMSVDLPQLVVSDSTLAYGLIARENRRAFSGRVVALTGSAGKTGCKEMIAAIFSQAGDVLATQSNFNNEIGVPLTLLQLQASHQYAVVEMGARHQGDIKYLCRFAEPDIALVTNVMPVHLEIFGDIDTIAATKGEIFESVADKGIAVINLDEKYVEQWLLQAGNARVFSFSVKNKTAAVYAEQIELQESGCVQFLLCHKDEKLLINLPLLGRHNVSNALAAATVAIAANLSLQHVKAGLENVAPVNGRLQTINLNGLVVVDDSYNASPGSVQAAIDVLAEFKGRRCLVLGTMGELGAQAEMMHCHVAKYASDKGIDQLFFVGEFAKKMAAQAGANASSFADVESLLEKLTLLEKNNVILVKGSRSAKMERVVNALVEAHTTIRGDQ
jgi:UDP-N-acetylmuramoyl-tripeptide--D-alanyl-D-alanine ligase